MSLSIKTRKKEKTAVIELQGEIDMFVSPNFRDKLLLACNKEVKEVIVDFSRVSFMDSSGVATLVEGLKWSRKEGKSLVLRNVGTNVRNSLSLTKLETVFTIMPHAHNSCFH